MSSVAFCAVTYFLQSIWLVPVVVGAAWLGALLLRRVEPSITHRLFVVATFAAALVPAVPALREVLLRARVQEGIATRATVILHAPGSTHGPFGLARWALTTGWFRALAVLYAAALAWAVLRFVRSMVVTARLRRDATAYTLPPGAGVIWRELEEWCGVKTAVCTSPGVRGPAVLGIWRPMLIVPPGFFERASEGEIRAALAHEAAHLRRRDYGRNLVYEVVSLPVAYHPLLWALKARVMQTREMVCDAEAARLSALGRHYAEALLRLALLVSQAPRVLNANAVGIFDAHSLEERVMELSKGTRKMTAGRRGGLTAASVGCVLLSVVAGAAAPRVERVGTSSKDTSGLVYTVGKDASAPTLVAQMDPQFPPEYRGSKATFDGTCRIKLVVDATGVPRDLQVARSLGKEFDESAMRAVAQYRFKPAMHDGQPVPVALYVDVRFQKF